LRRSCPQHTSPREWWRIATLVDGEPVGFVTPARNAYNPVNFERAIIMTWPSPVEG
jgi:hypothetical protein